MTNEEAFNNWWEGMAGKMVPVHEYNSFSEAIAHTAWQAAIAYMQEQNKSAEQSEPVAWYTEDYKEDKSATTWDKSIAERWKGKGWPVNELFTTPQRQHPLKRLSYDQVEALYDGGSWHDFANAIMDEMERINK